MTVKNLISLQLKASVESQADAAVPRKQAREGRISGLMPMTDKPRQFLVFITLEDGVGVVLHQRGVGRVKVLLRAKVADDMRGGSTEWIEAAAGAEFIDRDAELLVGRAVRFQFRPTAGGQRNAVAVENAAARNLFREGTHARIVLRALDAILFYGVRVAGQVVGTEDDLIARRRAQQHDQYNGQDSL